MRQKVTQDIKKKKARSIKVEISTRMDPTKNVSKKIIKKNSPRSQRKRIIKVNWQIQVTKKIH